VCCQLCAFWILLSRSLLKASHSSARRGIGLVLWIVSARDGDHLSLFHACASLLRHHFGGAVANDHLRFRIGVDEDAVFTLPQRMDGCVRSVDFRIRFASTQYGIRCQALPQLNLNPVPRQCGHIGRHIARHPQYVGIVKL